MCDYCKLSDPEKVWDLPCMFTTTLTIFYLVYHLITYETETSLIELLDYALFVVQINTNISAI